MTDTRHEMLAREWVLHQKVLESYLRAAVRDYQVVEELMQRVAVAAVRKIEEYDPARPFVAWLLGMARLEVLKHRDETRRDRHLFDSDMLDRLARMYSELSPRLNAMDEALRDCLDKLPERAHHTIVMRYRDAASPAMIAESQQVSGDSVRSLLKRTRQMLRQCIEQQLGWAGGDA